MFTAEEATQERVDAYVAALEQEKAGYEARINAIESGKHDPTGKTVEQLKARIRQVQDELARATGGKKQAAGRGKKPAEETAAE